jgi:hypothetical protein
MWPGWDTFMLLTWFHDIVFLLLIGFGYSGFTVFAILIPHTVELDRTFFDNYFQD